MPNTKSAEKRMNVSQKKHLINKSKKSEISTYIKKFQKLIAEKDLESAEQTYKKLVNLLDSASKNSVIHKNNASRKQAYFAKILDTAKKELSSLQN